MESHDAAYQLVALATNASTDSAFPGLKVLGFELEPMDPDNKNTINLIVYACQAAQSWADRGDDSAAYGRLETMIEYDIADLAKARTALHRARRLGCYLNGESDGVH